MLLHCRFGQGEGRFQDIGTKLPDPCLASLCSHWEIPRIDTEPRPGNRCLQTFPGHLQNEFARAVIGETRSHFGAHRCTKHRSEAIGHDMQDHPAVAFDKGPVGSGHRGRPLARYHLAGLPRLRRTDHRGSGRHGGDHIAAGARFDACRGTDSHDHTIAATDAKRRAATIETSWWSCAFRGDPVGDSDLIRSPIPI